MSDRAPSQRYPSQRRRTALLPAIVGILALLIGIAFVGTDGFLVVRFVVSIFALIVAVFAWQARQWWWLAGLVPIAIVFNPVFPIELPADWALGVQYVSALVFLVAGIVIRSEESPAKR